MQEKKHQQINIKIPIELWDKVEISFVKAKQNDPQRSLSKENHIIGIIENGVENY